MKINNLEAIINSQNSNHSKLQAEREAERKRETRSQRARRKRDAENMRINKQIKADVEANNLVNLPIDEPEFEDEQANMKTLLKVQKRGRKKKKSNKKLYSYSLTSEARRKLRVIANRLGFKSSSGFLDYLCTHPDEFTWPTCKPKTNTKKLTSFTLTPQAHKFLIKKAHKNNYKSVSGFLTDVFSKSLPETKEIPPKR